MSSTDRFHRAARDGFLDLLREANRKDCNAQDEDGMTPTLLAAACGNLEALRLIVGRGGDPDKCDWYGSTALHCCAANGHINCVSFLVNFGVNLWALDNEFHTPKDVAGNKNNEDILRFLDDEMNKQAKLNKKNVQSLKEKAVKDAEKRVKEFEKLRVKAIKKAAKEDKKLLKEREKMGTELGADSRKSSLGMLSGIRRDSRVLYAPPKYSDIVSNPNSGAKKTLSGISKKIQQQKLKSPNSPVDAGDFKVREFENGFSNGPRSVRSLAGLRRDSEVLYVPKYDMPGDLNSNGSRRGDSGVQTGRSSSIQQLFNDENSAGMFERPGFGNVAFRKNSLNATMLSMSMDLANGLGKKRPALSGMGGESGDDEAELGSAGEGSGRDSIGSAGSLARRNQTDKWSDIVKDYDDEIEESSPISALETFLTAHDLMACFHYLRQEHIDFKALLLLNEEDLKEIGIPMGIRKKMMEAINRRKNILNDAGDVYDSRL